MFFFEPLYSLLGALGLPLLVCALITIIILTERVFVLARCELCNQLEDRCQALLNAQTLDASPDNLAQKTQLSKFNGNPVLDDLINHWLSQQKRRLLSGLKCLQIIAICAPLLGLLGTVLGLMETFQALSQHRGPIEPALLAGGLGLAMKTTAAGLIIALPALAGFHLLHAWTDRLLQNFALHHNGKQLSDQGLVLDFKHD
ncbi:MotA/TolQ/ExbB proton channel family protein [Simiduia litorea]|uniref:MotA/TolQ/ExbB proton channel family protein n=1 Tax=Simiduia litorea TaxID=1435348 RepID=UPI0036F1DA78